ncbi:hypothetical protein AYI68_g2938 [Smittium mucronatum]|uniref:Pesticidal crystal protein cry11Bb n=1 Tax=Smittium mucronatum TaxID=133383 RepID=A0A1R0H1E3_9FUNG|nr:hypothetical protein AYI68_g2938 [Smittium mucronatum]
MYSGNYGNNQGGYDQGYNNQGYNNQGGYDNQGYNNQGGYDNQVGYNNQPQYDNQPQYGNNNAGGSMDDFNIPDGDLSVDDYMRIFSNGDTQGVGSISVPDNVGSRDLEGFDINELQQNAAMMDQYGQSGDRGIFDAGRGKSSKTHQVIAGAAAWQALKWYENKQKRSGKRVSHSTLKKMLAAFAAAKAVKYFETSGNLQSGMSRDVVAQTAARDAVFAMESKFADDSQPQYTYNDNDAGGEAASFDQFGSSNNNYNNNQPGYDQGYNNNQGYNNQGYNNQGGYNQGGYNQGY